ncbi:hypothetical protein RJT34_32695 [Clitoria ternatea]|uniref:Phytocyanin domain-containing protein n=1 Tax=Clitoria ternatea TaxID=43366 RepID=A0AAN9EWK0_CLITE
MATFLVIMLSMWLLISCSQAKEYVVGGTENSWKIPLSSPNSLTQWSNTHQFRIGDALIFKYDREIESVHKVNETDYSRCITKGGKHVVYNDGNTRVLLNESGTLHFISGTKDHCRKGLKLVVLITSNKSKKKSSSPSPLSSPSPSPSPFPLTSSSLSSPSPSPILPNNQGVAQCGGLIQAITWLGFSLMFLI